jgi:hypothetical protein
MELSRLRLNALDLAKERSDLEARLLKRERFVKGSMVYLRTRCGKPNCRCQRSKKQRHGPRLYVSVVLKGKQRMVYVPKDWEEKTQALVEQAKSFRLARKEWLKINQRLWKMFMDMERLKTQSLPYEPKKKVR